MMADSPTIAMLSKSSQISRRIISSHAAPGSLVWSIGMRRSGSVRVCFLSFLEFIIGSGNEPVTLPHGEQIGFLVTEANVIHKSKYLV